MSAVRAAAIFWLLAVACGAVWADDLDLFDPLASERTILVGFKDSEIGRTVQSGSTTDAYRHRGRYRDSAWSRRIADTIAEQYRLQELTAWPITELGIHCVVYRIAPDDSPDAVLTRLTSDARFDLVQKMHVYKTRAVNYSDPYFRLQNGIKAIGIDKIHAITTGRNIKVGIVDTGIDLEHPDLVGQIVANENFVKNISADFSTDRHGTAVAGVIAARMNNGTGIVGIAPNASLVALKACWPTSEDQEESTCNTLSLALAINTAIRLGVDVINMSLSGPNDPLLTGLLRRAAKKNIVLVAADPGPAAGDDERFPASLADVIGVQSQPERLAAAPSIRDVATMAPGEAILTTVPHGGYDFVSGSSLAAAHVSGIVALLLQLKPDLSAGKTRAILNKAQLTGGRAKRTALGVNANSAVSELCQMIKCANFNLSN